MRYVFSGVQRFAARPTMFNLNSDDSLLLTRDARVTSDGLAPIIVANGALVQSDGVVTTTIGAGINLALGAALVNNGTLDVTMRGEQPNGYAVAVSQGNSANGAPVTILNNGTIASHGDFGTIDVRGADTDITNYGTITADRGPFAIGSGSGTVFNTTVANYGTITGSILLDGTNGTQTGWSQTIGNAGQILGDVRTGSDGDVVTNAGLISGNIATGDGVDRMLNLGNVLGSVDLGAGSDAFHGTYGTVAGTIQGGLGSDVIFGGTGNDRIYGDDIANSPSGGNDTLYGGLGNDTIYGGYGIDLIYGNQGDDVLYGNQGADWIHGGQGNDTIYGGQGGDTVNGGVGNDVLAGNLGDDLFVFASGFGQDRIADFSTVSGNNDLIQFQAGTFATYADLQASMVQQGADVVVTLDAANTITIANVSMAALTADHFIFG